VFGRELEPGITILVDKKADTEDEVELTLIPGAPPEEPERRSPFARGAGRRRRRRLGTSPPRSQQ
jgi:hypothetical protein